MESISYYGGSDEEPENSNNSKLRDNPPTNNYGQYESSSGHTSSDMADSRRRKVTDDTNYEEIQMDLSEDSNENHSSQSKVSDLKPKKSATDFTSQLSQRSDKHNHSDDKPVRSASKEHDRNRGDKSKECTSRDRFSDKSRDKKEERYRSKDKDRERDTDRDRDRYSRDRGRSKAEKDDKYSRYRDNRSDNRRDRNDRNDRHDRHDRNDQRRDRTNNDKDRKRSYESYERERDKRPSTRSKSRSRSRSRDRSNNTRSQIHDRSSIKEPPKSLMSLQLPQMPLSNSSTLAAKPQEPVTAPPNIISPLLVSARYTEQMQKRKLLWGNKKAEGEQQQTTNNKWEQTKFSQDSDGKMASKFLRLMGMKDAPKVAEDETQKAPDSIKKQNEMLSSMEQQYEVARQMTHTMRGMGLGFGTQPRHY